MAEAKKFDVAIVGGGIAGLTLAIALYKRGVPVMIYEQAPKFGEIGAGVSFSPNAVQAMKICDKGIYDAFEKVCTRNVWPSKQKVWFDYLDGYDNAANKAGHQDAAFTISNNLGQNAVHRAAFLDEMVKLVPKGLAKFGKRLDTITESEDGKMVMNFLDGTTAEADCVIGCDGIKSRVRQILFGKDHPSARPVYTHKYAYRGLIPMEKAVVAVGEERAQNACMHVRMSV
jgi:salicylate hydroxylase